MRIATRRRLPSLTTTTQLAALATVPPLPPFKVHIGRRLIVVPQRPLLTSAKQATNVVSTINARVWRPCTSPPIRTRQPPRIWLGHGFVATPLPAPITLREALTYILENCAGITAVCGGRVYPGLRPQDADTNPCVVYTVGSDVPGMNLLGQDGTSIARVKIEFIGPDLSQSVAMQVAFFAAFGGFKGMIKNKEIMRAKLGDEEDEAEFADTGSDDRVQSISDTYVIRHRIPVTRF
jgi:hypothetical protein